MSIQKIKNLFSRSQFEPTSLSSRYQFKRYGSKVELKNSIKWNLLFLFGTVSVSIYLVSNISTDKTKWATVAFCALIIIFPIIKIFNQTPHIKIDKSGVTFKRGNLIQWSEISSTEIEEMNNDTLIYRLRITFNGKTKTVDLTDLNYTKDEISHIIEHYKKNNAS